MLVNSGWMFVFPTNTIAPPINALLTWSTVQTTAQKSSSVIFQIGAGRITLIVHIPACVRIFVTIRCGDVVKARTKSPRSAQCCISDESRVKLTDEENDPVDNVQSTDKQEQKY